MRIKICCIQSPEEAELALQLGAHALGLVSEMPTGNGVIHDDTIRQIVACVPPTYSTVLLTSRDDASAVVEHQRSTGVTTLQLVGSIDPDGISQVREAIPGIQLIKVIHVTDSSSIQLAADYFESADALLLDTSIQSVEGTALGGTGVPHDWTVSREIVSKSSLPVFLAGGLTPENVDEAVRRVRPFGVDVCSGLRPNGTLDRELTKEFVARATGAAV